MAKKNKVKSKKYKTQPRNSEQSLQPRRGNIRHNDSEQGPAATAAFTLADEARQTGQHDHSFWDQETKLRAQPVTFMSAGVTEPLNDRKKESQHGFKDEEMRAGKTTTPDPVYSDDNTDMASIGTGAREDQSSRRTKLRKDEEDVFFYDTSKTTQKNIDAVDLRTIITTDADEQSDDPSSGEEVILFKGRSKANNTPHDNISLVNITSEINELQRELCDGGAMDSSRDGQPSERKAKRVHRRQISRKCKRDNSKKDDDEDKLLADYIANLRENGELAEIMGLAPEADEVPQQECSGSAASDSDDSDSDASTGHRTISPGYRLREDHTSYNVEYKDRRGVSTSPETQEGGPETRDILAIDYVDFDPMDWEKPSLRRRKGKGAKASLNLQFADLDVETEQRLQEAWRSDRLKKAERKRERENLRAAGLLGKNATDAGDLRVRYPTGMSTEQVMDEMKHFLINSNASLCFPPMGKNVRKVIHEVANKLNVKSKSLGKGDQRRPVLYRTNRTLQYNAAAYEQIVGRVNRRYFPRLDSKSKKGSRHAASGNGYTAAASYRDGEVVGGAAPELGTENKGRSMLEKMGWSQGTALGSLENKGILLPVTQTMKRSKAGLG